MTISRRSSFTSLLFFTFFFKTLIAQDSFNLLAQNPSLITLYGDAKLIKNSTLQLSSAARTGGSAIYKQPIKIYAGTPKKLVSISTYFAFHLSYGNTLAFSMVPVGFPLNGSFGVMGSSKKFNLLSVEFEEHVGFMSVKVMRNMSSVNLLVNATSVKMHTWIDYEAGSKRLEVRVNKFGETRPVDPVLFVPVDLWKIWPKSKRVYVGLSSLNRNSSQGCEVDSWRFKASVAPDWMHSQPLDPMVLNQGHEVKVVVPKESDCVLKILVALILGIGCGALGAFVGMFMCTVMSNRKTRPIVPEEFAVKSLQEYEHKKLKIVLDEASANEK